MWQEDFRTKVFTFDHLPPLFKNLGNVNMVVLIDWSLTSGVIRQDSPKTPEPAQRAPLCPDSQEVLHSLPVHHGPIFWPIKTNKERRQPRLLSHFLFETYSSTGLAAVYKISWFSVTSRNFNLPLLVCCSQNDWLSRAFILPHLHSSLDLKL